MDQNTTVFKPQRDESKRVKEIRRYNIRIFFKIR